MRVIFFLLLFSAPAIAQLESVNSNAWLHYMGSFNLNPKYGVSLEATHRMSNFTQDFQQFFVRPSFDYKLKSNLTASLGYTYVLTGVYGSPAMNKRNMPENHVWLQGSIQNKIGKVSITNRLRNENRFVGIASPNLEINDVDYRNRMRYMLLASLPIVQLNNSQSLNGIIGNEIFLNVGENAGATLVNQNRVIAGLGYKLNGSNQIQLAYILQNIWNYGNTIKEDNSTLRLSYVSSLKLFKEKRPVFTPNDKVLSFN